MMSPHCPVDSTLLEARVIRDSLAKPHRIRVMAPTTTSSYPWESTTTVCAHPPTAKVSAFSASSPCEELKKFAALILLTTERR